MQDKKQTKSKTIIIALFIVLGLVLIASIVTLGMHIFDDSGDLLEKNVIGKSAVELEEKFGEPKAKEPNLPANELEEGYVIYPYYDMFGDFNDYWKITIEDGKAVDMELYIPEE